MSLLHRNGRGWADWPNIGTGGPRIAMEMMLGLLVIEQWPGDGGIDLSYYLFWSRDIGQKAALLAYVFFCSGALLSLPCCFIGGRLIDVLTVVAD